MESVSIGLLPLHAGLVAAYMFPQSLLLRDAVQMRWMWLRYCINIIIAAFSLRELTRVRFWFTRWSTPHFRSRGESLPPARAWQEDLSIAKMVLCLIGPTWLMGYGSVLTPWHSLASSSIAARDDSCAAWRNALSVTHGVLLGMVLVGMMLVSTCWGLFIYWHDQLDATGGSAVAATPAGQRMIAHRSTFLGLLSILGKNFIYPVMPFLVVCDALYGYRCVDSSRLGLSYLIFVSVVAALPFCMRICFD